MRIVIDTNIILEQNKVLNFSFCNFPFAFPKTSIIRALKRIHNRADKFVA